MKRPIIAMLAAAAFCLNLNAATGTQDGEGTAKRRPESADIEFKIVSKCFATSELAGKANDAMVLDFVANLKSYISADNAHERIETKFISNSEFSDSIYVEEKRQLICQGTFQQTTQVILKTEGMDTFSEDLSSIRKLVRTKDTRVKGQQESPATFVEIARISMEICEETEKAMDIECLKEACVDAKDNMRTMVSAMGGTGTIKCTEMSRTTNIYSGRRMEYAAASFAEDASDTVVPFDINDIVRTARVSCQFSFDDICFSVIPGSEDSDFDN
jgi:hypothetical protein